MSKARAAAARKANVARRGGQAEASSSASPSSNEEASPEADTSVRWPVQKIEHRNIERLIPYAGNARTHGLEQGDQIAGHGRILAAQQLGITTVPVMIARGKVTGGIPLSARLTATSGPCWSKTPPWTSASPPWIRS